MKKKQFKPQTVERHLDSDYELGQDITVEIWKDPSRQIVLDILNIMGKTEEDFDDTEDTDREQLDSRYFECASLLLVDCDIKGVDFSTPESTRVAFSLDFLPWGIFHQTMLLYMTELMEEYNMLKNVLRRVSKKQNPPEEESNSGNENDKKADT